MRMQENQKENNEQNRLLKAINEKVNKMAREMEHTTIADSRGVGLVLSPKLSRLYRNS
jgi:Skp family chaperone for outer membrane proteins